MKVLVIPEDPTYNGYILKPLVERLMREVGRPTAKVEVFRGASAQGYDRIKAALPEICFRYSYVALLLFMPDQDCKIRTVEFLALEQMAIDNGARLLICAAVHEVEIWLLAGHTEKLPEGWSLLRMECHPKERFFESFIQQYGDNSPGQGRERLMKVTLQNFAGLLARCPELRDLQERIRQTVAALP